VCGLLWLRSPKKRFGSKFPFQMAKREAGAELIEEILIQGEEGVVA
jgi:hypothetical protein